MKKIENDLTEKELAAFLSVTTRTLQNWRAKGTAPKYYRMGHKLVRYQQKDVLAWLKSKEVIMPRKDGGAKCKSRSQG